METFTEKFEWNCNQRKKRRDLFFDITFDLFDINHSDALGRMKNEEDRNFLMLHRQKERSHFMFSID